MNKQKTSFKTAEELDKAILQEKLKGTPDLEIGRKYGVTYRYIEKLITKTQGVNISSLKSPRKIKNLSPKNFEEEKTTVWSFRERGNWATHSSAYRGNWSPYIPRNVILKYSHPGELVLDYFCGAGTTAVECKLLGRKCIALDINDKAIELAKRNIDFEVDSGQVSFLQKEKVKSYEPDLQIGDARDLSFLPDNSIDLICAHPPYANIINYTDAKTGDLSFCDIDEFLQEMKKVAEESFRVLKPGRQCAILIGDMRRKKHVLPLGFKLIDIYLKTGFKLRELVIKRQHNCKTTGFWYTNSIKYNFLLLAHEYLPIFEKPACSGLEKKEEKNLIDKNIVPVLVEPSLKKDLDEQETSTVWIFPQEEFEERLNKNVIDRYAEGENYSALSFISKPNEEMKLSEMDSKDKLKLFFIKSPFLKDSPSSSQIEYYLEKLVEVVDEKITSLQKEGFLVIQTQDVRIDGYIEPLAKIITDKLRNENLWLKEIIIATPNEKDLKSEGAANYLEIIHQYLLVYEVTK